jgi:hypothetical protein
MRRLIFLLASVLLLASCIGIDGKMTIRSDGSGILELTYKISQTIADLGRSGADKGPLPLPVSREDFERGIAGVQGVELRSISRTENETDITIRAILAFDSVESLARVAAFQDAPPAVAVSGTRHTFTQSITKAADQPISQESLEMLDAFFDGYSIKLVFEAPSTIQSHSLGTLSADKKTLTYSSTVKDLVTAKTDVEMSFSW